MNSTTFSGFITERFNAKKEKNPNYSFRAFCRDLNMSPGRMTNFIKRREFPSDETIAKIAVNLKLSQEENLFLLAIIEEEKYLRRGIKFSKRLTADEFKLVSGWKTWSILTLFQSSEKYNTVEAISKHLRLSVTEVKKSLQNLEEVGLIGKEQDEYFLLVKNVTTTNDIPNADIRRTHKEFIKLAEESIETVPVLERDITGITMCIDKNMLPELKKAIAEFRAKFNQMAVAENTTDLYQLNIQFFPILGSEKDSK